ncbi:MAG: DUF4199 domain-containing protein [Bacteroidota bacterium]
MKKISIELYYGALIGTGVFIWLILEFLFGLHDKHHNIFTKVTHFVLLIPTIGIYKGIFKKKKSRIKNPFSFKQGFLTGASISIIYTAIAAFGQLFYHKLVNKRYFEFMIQQSREKGIPLEDAQSYFNTSNYVLSVIVTYFLFGVIISIIVSTFARRA